MNISGKQYYFGPYLWSTTLPQDLIDELLVEGRKSVQDHVPSLAGIIESEKGYDESYRHVFAQKIQPYVSQYLNNCGKYLKQSNQRFKFLKQVNLMSLWCNFMKKGECNPPHIHDGDLSFVIFLKVPKEIKKECDEYRGRSSGPGCIEFSYGEFHPNITTKNSFFPEENQMFIFPAVLQHNVNSFQSDVERVSVSGNFMFEYNEN